MKIIILFALASVGVCTESGSSDPPPPKECSTSEPYPPTFDRCDVFKNEFENDENCLKHALESVPQLLEIAKKLICKHKRNELDKSFGYYEAFEKEMRDFMGCTGCFVGEILGLEEILGHLGAAVGDVVGISVEIIGELIHGTGLLNPALDLICDLLAEDLTSKCVEMISNSDLTANTKPLGKLACMAEDDTLDMKELFKSLIDLGCPLEDLLGILDTLENVSQDIRDALDSLLRSLLGALKKIPVVRNLLGGTVCAVSGLLSGLGD